MPRVSFFPFLALGICCVSGWATLQAAGAAQQDSLEGTFGESTLVRRIQWPVRFIPKRPGGCEGIQPGQVLVREDRMPIVPDLVEAPGARFGRGRLKTIHVVLIDTSVSMRTRLDRAKQAAGEYIASLPAEDRVMLASFSDNLVLNAPLTRDRDKLHAALERIGIGWKTAFNDALYYVIRYLRTRPERKVVIVLTDGCDSASLPMHPLRNVIELAESTEKLAVFPIGVDLPGTCVPLSFNPGAVDGPEIMLESLARRSGGKLFRANGAAAFSGIFRSIRERMEHEGFVSYRPIPFGLGPKDRPEEQDHRKRRVKIGSTVPKLCRVESAGPRVRLETRNPAKRRGELDGPDAALPAVGRRIAFEDWWSETGAVEAAYLDLGADGIQGRAADILNERSGLYASVAFWERGKYRTIWDARAELGQRDFELLVPPFDFLRRQLTSPEALMLHLLENDARPFAAAHGARNRRDAARRELNPLWIHGQTLIELREIFGQGLFGYEGYREFAQARLEEDYRAEMRRTLDESTLLADLPVDQLAALRQTIGQLRPRPQPAHMQRYLAEWLGDISARDLVVGFERWVANRLLEVGLDDATSGRLLQTIEARWRDLGEWFPPPTRVRIITPLIPGFDAERGLVGFYRILLPQVSWLEAPADRVPVAPLGLAFVRHLLESSEQSLVGRVRLGEIAYGAGSKRALRRMMREAKSRSRETAVVRLELQEPEGAAAALDLTVLYKSGGPRPAPLCVDFGGADPDAATVWTRSLSKTILGLVPECGAGL